MTTSQLLFSLHQANIERQKEWRNEGQQLPLCYWGNAIAGEVGEMCNVIKKIERAGHGMAGSKASLLDLAHEMADVLIYLDLLATECDINLPLAVAQKFNATSEKLSFNTKMAENW